MHIVLAVLAAIVLGFALWAVVGAVNMPSHGRGCDCGECHAWHARQYDKQWGRK